MNVLETANDNALPTAAAPGSKVTATKDFTTAQIASSIRADVKAAVKAGHLPKATYSVRTDTYSMGSSITVKASDVPFPVLNPEAYRDQHGPCVGRLLPAAKALEEKLEAIVDAYHWDASDHANDYYLERFAKTVTVEAHPGEYDAIVEALRQEREQARP